MPTLAPIVDPGAVDGERLLQDEHDPLGDGGGGPIVAEVGAQHGELVAAEASHHVAGPQHRADAAGDLRQHQVAGVGRASLTPLNPSRST